MKEKKKSLKKPKQPNSFLRFSGIGIQMGTTIFVGAYFGKWLDQKYPHDKNWFTIIFTLLGVAVALVNILRQLNKSNED